MYSRDDMDRYNMPFEVLSNIEDYKYDGNKESITPSLIQQAGSTYRSCQNVSEEPKAMKQREETPSK